MDDDYPRPLITCTKCGSTGRFRPADVEENNSGCLIFMFGGLLPYLLFRSSQRGKVICDRCHYVFTPPSQPLGREGALGMAIIFLVSAVMVILFYYLMQK
jgi:hypothetical protein